MQKKKLLLPKCNHLVSIQIAKQKVTLILEKKIFLSEAVKTLIDKLLKIESV